MCEIMEKYLTILSEAGLKQILQTKRKPYDAKSAVKKARVELRKQGLKV